MTVPISDRRLLSKAIARCYFPIKIRNYQRVTILGINITREVTTKQHLLVILEMTQIWNAENFAKLFFPEVRLNATTYKLYSPVKIPLPLPSLKKRIFPSSNWILINLVMKFYWKSTNIDCEENVIVLLKTEMLRNKGALKTAYNMKWDSSYCQKIILTTYVYPIVTSYNLIIMYIIRYK